MTVVGKAFTFLIFVTSLAFLAFSVMVYSNHVDWKTIAVDELRPELDAVDTEIRALNTERNELKKAIRHEQAALRSALVALEARAVQTQTLLAQKEKDNSKLAAERLANLEDLRMIQDELKQLVADIEEVEQDVHDLQLKSESEFDRVVDLTAEIHEAVGVHRRLTERYQQLQLQIEQITGESPATSS